MHLFFQLISNNILLIYTSLYICVSFSCRIRTQFRHYWGRRSRIWGCVWSRRLAHKKIHYSVSVFLLRRRGYATLMKKNLLYNNYSEPMHLQPLNENTYWNAMKCNCVECDVFLVISSARWRRWGQGRDLTIIWWPNRK